MKNFIKTFLLIMFVGVFAFTNNVKAQMSGTYTVGSGGTYASLTVAYNALVSNGINAPVILSVISDLSGQQTLSDNVPGSSNINTVTITSFNGDATTVTIGNAANTALILDSVSNLVFKNITIGTTTDTTINGVEFRGFCANILFHSCVIQAYDLASNNNYAAVRCENPTSSQSTNYLSNVRFIKNTIIGGYYNMYFRSPSGNSGNMSSKNASVVIDSNELKDACYYGIYAYYYAYYPSISYNSITSRTNSGNYRGIHSNQYTTIDSLQGNKISITGTGTFHGMYMNNYQNNKSTTYGADGPMCIANNEVRIKSTDTANIWGFYIGNGSSSSSNSLYDILHNSCYLEGTSGNVYGIQIEPKKTAYPTNVLNNLVYVSTSGNGYMINYVDTNCMNTSFGSVNYNNYYKSGGDTAYYGTTAYTTLKAWQDASYGQDTNSVNVNPPFLDVNKDLQLLSYHSLSCPLIVGIEKDIRNNSRKATTYMGCYEPYTIDLALKSLLSPLNNANFCQNNTSPIEVSIINIGNNDLNMNTSPLSVHVRVTGAINYQKDTIISTGTLTASQTMNIMMNNALALSDTGMYYVSAYFSKIDSNSFNDTVYSQFYVHRSYSYADTVTIYSSQLPYKRGDSTFTKGGNYTIVFTTINGCDSTIALTLIESDNYKINTTVTICDNQLPYTYKDSILAAAGLYELRYPASQGQCDTIVNLTLIVNSTYTKTDTMTICSSELPYDYGDSTFNATGNYTVVLKTINGCDSTINLTLVVNPTYTGTDTISVCASQFPFTYGDSLFTAEGDYTVVFTTINGCDSTIALTLIEDDAYKVKTTITICDDQLPYTYNDSILTDAGLYQFEYPASPGGCDTILYVTLVVNSTYNETDTITICSSELPYTYGDSVFTEGGDYILPYLTEFGCDSVVNLHLEVIEIPISPLVINGNTTITTAGQYTYYVDPVEGADSYVWTISNNNWTGSSTTESIELTISDAGTGTLAVKAVNICGKSDTAALDISSSVGILESGIKACYLGQNIPNPANTNTLIPFSIPEAGNVSFEVVSITGQVLYKKDIQALTGSNSIELNTETLSAGIYYYRIEFNGQRLVKKMTIQR